MNARIPTVPRRGQTDADQAAGFAPPLAPLAMPKQVLTTDAGGLRRLVSGVVATLAGGLHRSG